MDETSANHVQGLALSKGRGDRHRISAPASSNHFLDAIQTHPSPDVCGHVVFVLSRPLRFRPQSVQPERVVALWKWSVKPLRYHTVESWPLVVPPLKRQRANRKTGL